MNPRPGRALELSAYDGMAIPNSIEADPNPTYVALTERSLREILRDARVRRLGPPTGRYNCHGLVFASRRTGIPPASMPASIEPEVLLKRDLYGRVAPPYRIGDVVAYRALGGEIEHTGLICRVESIGAEQFLFVWSMWGCLGEFEHPVMVCPYATSSIEFWRLGTAP